MWKPFTRGTKQRRHQIDLSTLSKAMESSQAKAKSPRKYKGFRTAWLLLCGPLEHGSKNENSRDLKQEDKIMKKLSTISILALSVTFALTTASFAGAVANNSQNTKAMDAQTIAQLQVAAQQALADGRNGGKNNPEYGRKNYEINQLIDKLQSGQQVDPAEIDKAMEPVHIW
jgi:hypothetical protein